MIKCNKCKYEYLSKEEYPCSVCRYRFNDKKLVVLGKINYFEPKEKEHSSNCTISAKECNKAFKNKDYGYEKISNDEIDMVNHPPHYQHGIEPIEFIESHNLNFNLGSAVKYIARAPYKGKELEDLKKAKWYLEREIKKMTGNDVELIRKMLKKQAKLDKAIMKEYGLEELDEEKLNLAILDEIGELTHELKANWCWWKKTQPLVDKEKVLGELVDIWHFVLSYQNNFNEGEEGLGSAPDVKKRVKQQCDLMHSIDDALIYEFIQLVSYPFYRIESLIAITEYLGFTIEQVYKAYCDKNKINYQRLKEGY